MPPSGDKWETHTWLYEVLKSQSGSRLFVSQAEVYGYAVSL